LPLIVFGSAATCDLNHILLDDTRPTRFIGHTPTSMPNRTDYVSTGQVMSVLFEETGPAPFLLNKSYTITAGIEVPEDGAEGMLMTDGDRFGVYGSILLEGVPTFAWNLVQLEHVKCQGKESLKPGRCKLVFDSDCDHGQVCHADKSADQHGVI
jgi:hypothetical protein